jgi:hypothetical protein
MFKITLSNNSSYSEVGQRNPLRWKTLFKNEDGSFIDQSGWIKCKDFFNDTVAFFKENSVFSIYGYKNDIKKNEEGVYFLLKYIADKKTFFQNMEMVNKQLYKDLSCTVECQDHEEDEVIICIPNAMWESTYRISLITMVVRLCNYGVKYAEWADLWTSSAPSQQLEHAFSPDAIKNVQENGFNVPVKFTKYWYYAGPQYNSETTPKQTGSIIHNNGVSNWSMYMKQA